MKIGIVGSRTITDYNTVEMALQQSPWYRPTSFALDKYTFVSGGADGVDTIAEEIAEEHSTQEFSHMDIEIHVIEPDWDDWSRGHPAKVRNTEIVEESDVIVAVWNGKSTGTRDTIDKALDRGVPIFVEVVE